MSARYNKYDIVYTSAYTLIEILVTLTIIGLLFSFGYVNFRDFSRRQAVADAAKSIQGDLRIAQTDATTGQKPADGSCSLPKTLDGYNFEVFPPAEYKIEAICGVTTTVVKDVTLPAGISVTAPSPNPLQFKVLGQGTNISSGSWVLTLTQEGTNNTTAVTVNSGGDIQ